MTVVTDPDDLDRFQVIFSPVEEIISLCGTGTARQAVQTNGQTAGTTTFTRAAGDFTTDSVAVDDVLCILDDPSDDQGIIGHYRVTGSITATTLVVDRSITNHTGSDLTWRIYSPGTVGNSVADLSDGVTKQALYSFSKEEWRTLAAGLGNAEDLIQYDFPFTPITREQMIMGGVNGDAASAWTYADANGREATDSEGQPRELVRTGGWQERDASDNIIRRYPGFATLGTLDSDAQVAYQLGDATATPVDFKLTGTVNQAVLITGPDTGPDGGTGFAITTSNTITRADGGNWSTDGYLVGDYVLIRSAEDVGNNTTTGFGPLTSVGSGVDGAIVFSGTPLTDNANDTTMVLQPDHRRYFEMRVRKKARTYSQAGLSNIGVTTLEALVNRFPLSHATDPAILLQDGVMAGDGTATGEVFQESESLLTASDGVTETAPTAADDAFTLTSATGGFTATVARTLAILRAGDAFVISTGSDAGSYVIKSVDSDTVVSLFKDPLLTYTGGESTQSYDARTPLIDVGSAVASTATNGELTDAGATFGVDTAIGDRIVTAGDIVEIYSGTAGTLGYYKVTSQDSATVLTLEATSTDDQPFTVETNQSYRIYRSGMFLQRFETTAGDIAQDPSFNDVDPDTITRASGSFITDGYTDGMAVTVASANTAANDGTRIIDTVVALTLTLIAEETLTTDATDTSAVLSGDTGIVRTINSVDYPFHWRLFANGGTLAQFFQFIQWKLRLTSDIDGSSGTERGDVTPLLMSFTSPNGITIDMFPDDAAVADANNSTYQDISTDSRTNAFLVGITFSPNSNLTGSAGARIVAFFTTNPGGNFGSNTAVIVDDESSVDMDFTTVGGDIQRSFDYTNNAQGGRSPGTDAAITVVALGDDLAQHILTTATITQVNSLTIPVGPSLERNYST